jgi:hypothetical protein
MSDQDYDGVVPVKMFEDMRADLMWHLAGIENFCCGGLVGLRACIRRPCVSSATRSTICA